MQSRKACSTGHGVNLCRALSPDSHTEERKDLNEDRHLTHLSLRFFVEMHQYRYRAHVLLLILNQL